MLIFDNVNKTIKDDLASTITKDNKLSIAAACFSIYAYQALKKQLDGIDELRFILKNRNSNINVHNQNQLHPFYMVYVRDGSVVYIDHLQPKKLLDTLRQLCKGKIMPNSALCAQFNAETKDGRDMRKCSELLGYAINSIIDVNEESDITSLFKPGGTSALNTTITGLDDFELICFFVVR